MTDPTKKDDSDKAKAVKSAMTGTPDPAKPVAVSKPAEPAREPRKPGAPVSAAPTPTQATAASAKPPEMAKEPPKPAETSPAGAKPVTVPKDPPKASVPPSSPPSSAPVAKPGAASASGEPSKGPGGPQGPGATKGLGTPPSGGAAKAPPPKPPAAQPKKKRGCLGTLIWLVVILAVLGAVAYYTWPHWPEMVKRPVEAKIAEVVPTVQMPEERAALEDQLAAYKEQLSTLETKVAELADRKVMTPDEVKALVASGGGTGDATGGGTRSDNAEVSALTARLDALESAFMSVRSSETAGATGDGASTSAMAGATAAIGASMKVLSERVAKLEKDVTSVEDVKSRVNDMEARARAAPSSETKAAVVLAVSHLDHAVMQSVPFAAELDALKAVAGDDAALAEPIGVLEPLAASGVRSLVDLRASFPAVAREVSRVHADWTGEDWVDKALSRVTSLVSVRKTGEEALAAEGTDGAIAQAEAALMLGDVAAAVTAMERLEGPPAEAAAPWLAEARKREDALAALAALRQGAIALLAAGG